MFLFKVITLLFIALVVIESRSLRKRRQYARSSAYYSTNGIRLDQYVGYLLGLANAGNSLYPIGNNWFVPNNLLYPYNYPNGYAVQPPLSFYNYGYPTSNENAQIVQYGNSGIGMGYQSNLQAYIGQSYVPSNAWLPLPGSDRRRGLRRRR